jgi:hypothetical protein
MLVDCCLLPVASCQLPVVVYKNQECHLPAEMGDAREDRYRIYGRGGDVQ